MLLRGLFTFLGAGANYRVIALETVENNINFIETNQGQIDQWLSNQGY